MKTRNLYLTALAFYVCACDRHPAPHLAKKEPNYKKAESLFYYGNKDSAFYYFNDVAGNSKDSSQVAVSYSYMASIQSDAGDYFGSQENLLLSLKHLDEKKAGDHYCLSANYNELGLTSSRLGNYETAIRYYDLALRFSPEAKFKWRILNNKAVAFQNLQQYTQALSLYDSLLNVATPDTKEYARILSNLAKTKWLKDSSYNAVPPFSSALQIEKRVKDEWGQNASYAHLADYHFLPHPDSALFYSKMMYAIAQKLESPDDQLEALQKLIKLSPVQATQAYFERYLQLNDSLQQKRNAAKNQFALIRYEAEKHKAENLQLQKENAEKQSEMIRQRLIFIFAGLLLSLTIVFLIVWFRKRKQQVLLKAENTVRESRLKTSQKVHDIVANGLYRIMTEIEHQDHVEKNLLLDKIEDMYERSRDISYEKQDSAHAIFHDELNKLLESFANGSRRVLVVGSREELWERVSLNVRQEVKCILQELMVNMKKHSSAGNVVIKFGQQENQVQIQYTDDGIGLPAEFRYGNGLNNTVSRITTIRGKISFDNKTTTGLKILISFPIG
ncbi:tetratricopeptide repeat-containing sensor histidine kinase [Filimonas effusa]|uniref:histidine kinase n=1 Tax=Filimonas effusa TaxID=2508721 RepID=A0A4Q1DB46_9BACT|nr:tetratricopeptide repeat-containing sensor histidine kinase [Filimonas effusa]RXK85719.1 tetratricopeptide repeat protein [Filimonas effusa]